MHEIDFRKVDLNLLVIFEAIYACSNISQAAAQLGMTQPTMSNSLARLRTQLGDQLFTRVDRGVTPTAFAESVIPAVRSALSTLRTGLQSPMGFDYANAQRTFRIAMHGYSVVHLLPRILTSLKFIAPGITIEVLEPEWQNPFDILTSGRADISLDTFPQEEATVGFDALYDVKPVVIARRNHPCITGPLTTELYASLAHVTLPDIACRRIQIDSSLLLAGISRRVVCQVPTSSAVGPLVASTDMIALVPERYAQAVSMVYGLNVFEPPFPIRSEMLFAGWLKQRSSDPGLTWMRERIREATLNFETAAPLKAAKI